MSEACAGCSHPLIDHDRRGCELCECARPNGRRSDGSVISTCGCTAGTYENGWHEERMEFEAFARSLEAGYAWSREHLLNRVTSSAVPEHAASETTPDQAGSAGTENHNEQEQR